MNSDSHKLNTNNTTKPHATSTTTNSNDIEPLIRSILQKMNKLESLEEHVEYLRSEWYLTIEDLRLALNDKIQWSELQLPGRLKIELKKELIKINVNKNDNGETDNSTTINNNINNNSSINTDNDNITLSPKQEDISIKQLNTPITEIIIEGNDNNDNNDNELCELAIGNDAIASSKWLKCFSPEHESFYYVSQTTGESQWEEPDGPDDDIEEDEYSMALHAESLVDSNERLQYDSNIINDNDDNDYNDEHFNPPLPPSSSLSEEREPSYVYNTYDNDNDEWVYPTAPPVPSNIPTVVHAIPLNTYEAVPELPISNVRRHRHHQQQQQQQQSLPRYQQQQSPPINNISDNEEEELSSDDEAFVYDNSVEVDEVLVEQLVEMGFDRVSSKNELNRCRNQIDIAIARLVRFNEKHSRNIRVIEKPKPSSSSAGASSSSKTNTKPNTFLRKVIGVPKKVPISINLFGTRKNTDRNDDSNR